MYNWFFYASWIILIPAFIALAKSSTITKEFKPLAINIWLGVLAEVAATILRLTIKNNLYAYNIFMLLDFVILVWMFSNWGAFTRYHLLLKRGLLVFFLLLWATDNFIISSINRDNIIFRLAYSLALALVAINQLSTIYIKNNGYLVKNPYLYVCLGVIFYYSFSAFIYAINNSSLFEPGPALWKYTTLIYVIVNAVANLLYAIALLWMPKKAKSI
jgi:hypothetical protein